MGEDYPRPIHTQPLFPKRRQVEFSNSGVQVFSSAFWATGCLLPAMETPGRFLCSPNEHFDFLTAGFLT